MLIVAEFHPRLEVRALCESGPIDGIFDDREKDPRFGAPRGTVSEKGVEALISELKRWDPEPSR